MYLVSLTIDELEDITEAELNALLLSGEIVVGISPGPVWSPALSITNPPIFVLS